MKTRLLIIPSLLLTTLCGVKAQIEVDANGQIITNENEIYLSDVSGSKYGIGYNAFGASKMVLFSDDFIEFRESDANALCVRYEMNTRRTLFYDDIV